MFLQHSFVLQFLLNGFLEGGNQIPACSLLVCTTMCLDTEGCSPFFYSKKRKLCTLAGTRYFSSGGLIQAPEYKYYMMRPDCGPGWRILSDQCYQYGRDKQNFKMAKDNCTSIGGYLARTYTLWDDAIIRSILHEHRGSLWIGGTDEVTEGQWVWGNGQPVNLSLWSLGQPKGNTEYNCLEQWSTGWNDGLCTCALPYLCQK